MFFVLSKLLYFFVQPLGVISTLFLLSFVFSKKYKNKLRVTALILFLFYSNEYFANKALQLLEPEEVSIQTIPVYEYAIVLGGLTHYKRPFNDRPNFGEAADRITDALYLYKLKKIEKIVVSGGGTFLYENYSEAQELRKFLLLSGVAEDDILLEERARNTRENATYSYELMKSLEVKEPILIITSAFHMKRTRACFEKYDLDWHFFPSDFLSYPAKLTPESFYPSASALNKWEIIQKEVVGLLVYKLIGYA
jgi:uncharacterized SAM-binding protein YcdF (DUF218 family)